MKNLTKEQVYVLIDNQPDCDRAIEILTKAGEKISTSEDALDIDSRNKYLKFWNNWYIGCYDKELTQVTLDDLERILMPKIKKSELLKRIEKLENKVADLEEKSKVTVVYPPTWENDPSTIIGKWAEIIGKWAEIIEEPQYKEGTLGAFWDGDFDFALSKRCVWLGKLENQTKSGQFVMQETNMCYQNFKPLKFD